MVIRTGKCSAAFTDNYPNADQYEYVHAFVHLYAERYLYTKYDLYSFYDLHTVTGSFLRCERWRR
jgi:hypothetical protein